MTKARKYMAASVPRFLRQSRLNYLPSTAVIGSRLLKGDGGSNLYYDIIMLPVPEFTRMRGQVGLQHVIAPSLKMGPTFNPGFVLADVKEVIVPEGEPEPEAFAKNYFLIKFGLVVPDAPATETSSAPLEASTRKSPFSEVASEYTDREDNP